MWIALGIIAASALLYFRQGKNSVWGGLTFGLAIGVVIVAVSAVRGEIDFAVLGKSAVVGTLVGLAAELLGQIGDFTKRRSRSGLERELELAKEEESVAKADLEKIFPLWWADQPETEGGLDEALNTFIEQHNLLQPTDLAGSETLRYPGAKLRILDQSDLALGDPEGEHALERYKMSLHLSNSIHRDVPGLGSKRSREA